MNLEFDGNIQPVYSFYNHQKLGTALHELEQNSQDRVKVDQIGLSNQGRPIWRVKVGKGKKAVLASSYIHGNEPTGASVLLNLLRFLGSSESPLANRLRNELTFVAVPMANPDAVELNRHNNVMTWEQVVTHYPGLAEAIPPFYYKPVNGSDPAGFNVNLDFRSNFDYTPSSDDFPFHAGWLLTPEARALADVYKQLQIEFGKVDTYIDLHNQNADTAETDRVQETGEPAILSISGVMINEPHATIEYSKQLTLIAYDALIEHGYNRITRFPELHAPMTSLGAFAQNGSGVVLFEALHSSNLEQETYETIIKCEETAVLAVLEAIASGSVHSIDPQTYGRIPKGTLDPSKV